jgi:hypothetical protein
LEHVLSAGGEDVLIKFVAQAIQSSRWRVFVYREVYVSISIPCCVNSGGKAGTVRGRLVGYLGRKCVR